MLQLQELFETLATYRIGYADAENEEPNSESINGKEAIDLKELKRVDHILATLQRKLPPAPPPPPFPEGYAPSEMEKDLEKRASEQPTSVDPIIDQGPAKRTKF
ncbi:hypothetical protein ZIOFF_008034 [Zingiber officinale]|uniref:Uncharacterized protein n=1 Tax=Zingiber officinale TaxID=94328 RepID=A0A8J5IEU3_ZINOF|nr:hypothetical protein ZIOFF_008034 [Zingiber officinale]